MAKKDYLSDLEAVKHFDNAIIAIALAFITAIGFYQELVESNWLISIALGMFFMSLSLVVSAIYLDIKSVKKSKTQNKYHLRLFALILFLLAVLVSLVAKILLT